MDEIQLTREELYERIWTTPATKLAAELGISDVGLGKICRRMHIPKPPLGYWRRIETGHTVSRPALPKAKAGDPPLAFFPGKQSERESPPRFQLTNPDSMSRIAAERTEEQRIAVPETLQDAHSLVRKTERAYAKAKPGLYGYLSPTSAGPYSDLRVSREALDRALRILDALIKAAQARKLANKAGAISVEGEDITIRVSEKFTRSDNPDRGKPQKHVWDLPPRYIYEPTGKLTLVIEANLAGKRELSDKADRPLEDQLNEAIIKMLVLSEENKFERQLREDAERRRREEARQQQIARRLRQEERERRQLLEQQAASWSTAETVRAFVRALEQRLIAQVGSIDPASPDATWIAWAYKHADRLDPTLGDYLPNAIAELARKDQLKSWEEEEPFHRWYSR